MDVEGYEAEIISGGYQTIRTYKPVLFMEMHKGILGLNNSISLKFFHYCFPFRYLLAYVEFAILLHHQSLKQISHSINSRKTVEKSYAKY
jgi:hypothetical protein